MRAKLSAYRRDWHSYLTWQTEVDSIKKAQEWAANEAGKFLRYTINPDSFGKRAVDTRDASDKRLKFTWRQPEAKAELVVNCNQETPAPVEFYLHIDFTPEELAAIQTRLGEWVTAQTNPGVLLKEFDLLVKRGLVNTH